MDHISGGCCLCLDPYAERSTTIDNPQLKDQMMKVFYFSIHPKQGYCSGVCQSCSYAISEFYQYSEKVRQNQELMDRNVTNCDPTEDSKITLESVKVETQSYSGFPGFPQIIEDACEPNDEISGEGISSLDSKITLERVKVETQCCSGLPQMIENVCDPNLEISVEKVPILDSMITLESAKVETLSYSGLSQMIEDACDPDVEISGEEVPTLGSKITPESMKVESLSCWEHPETIENVCEPKHELSGEEKDPNSGDDESYEHSLGKLQAKQVGRSVKRELNDLKEAETTKSFKQTIRKTQRQKLNEEDQLFNEYFSMICSLCGISTATFSELVSHFRNKHQRRYGYVVCCNRKLFTRNTIRDHISFHANPETASVVFRCEMCGYKYKNQDSLNAHKLYKHSSEDQGPFKCDHCTRSFAMKSALIQHKKRQVKVKCPKCNKILACKDTLNRHMANQHSGKDRAMVCDTCGKEFLNKVCFDLHMKKHMGIEVPRFQCKICRRWLKSARNLRTHMKGVHTDKPKRKCDICLKEYPHSRALILHKFEAHAESKHECEFCGKKFFRAVLLREHRTTHTGEVLYSCEYCGIPINRQAYFYKHLKRQHPAEWAQKKRNVNVTERSVPSHECEFCGKTFNLAFLLNEHRTVHTGEDLYSCEYCAMPIKRRTYLYQHIKKQHPEEWAQKKLNAKVTQRSVLS